MVETLKYNIYLILLKTSCLYLDKKYKCVSFIVHFKDLTLSDRKGVLICLFSLKNWNA